MCVISVIIPVFNTSKVLNRCLDSVLCQTYTDWECLLVDDGSTDNSGAICDEYAKKDSRFRVFHQQNRGVSDARNVGLDNARGEWITFIDSDDWVEENLLKDYADNWGEVDFVIQNVIWHNSSRKGDFYISGEDFSGCSCYQEKLQKFYKTAIFGFTFNTIFKKEIIERNKLRFCEEFAFREDAHFKLRYAQSSTSVILIPSSNYHYYAPTAESFREYKKWRVSRVKVFYEINELLIDIIGENMISKIDIATPLYFEVMRMYYWPNIRREERIDVLKKYLYDNYIPYRGNQVRLIILHWCVRLLPPNCTDLIMTLLPKI